MIRKVETEEAIDYLLKHGNFDSYFGALLLIEHIESIEAKERKEYDLDSIVHRFRTSDVENIAKDFGHVNGVGREEGDSDLLLLSKVIKRLEELGAIVAWDNISFVIDLSKIYP